MTVAPHLEHGSERERQTVAGGTRGAADRQVAKRAAREGAAGMGTKGEWGVGGREGGREGR